MAAIAHNSHPGLVMHEIAKRAKSWPAKNAGVMVVFCIVFVGTSTLLQSRQPRHHGRGGYGVLLFANHVLQSLSLFSASSLASG